MIKNIILKIEESRNQLNKISPYQKEKLLAESRKLDLLILEYHKSATSTPNHQQERHAFNQFP